MSVAMERHRTTRWKLLNVANVSNTRAWTMSNKHRRRVSSLFDTPLSLAASMKGISLELAISWQSGVSNNPCSFIRYLNHNRKWRTCEFFSSLCRLVLNFREAEKKRKRDIGVKYRFLLFLIASVLRDLGKMGMASFRRGNEYLRMLLFYHSINIRICEWSWEEIYRNYH